MGILSFGLGFGLFFFFFFPKNPISLRSQVTYEVTNECEEPSLKLDFFFFPFFSFFFLRSAELGAFLNQGVHEIPDAQPLKSRAWPSCSVPGSVDSQQ